MLALPNNPRILITRTDRIGDLVLTTPVFKSIREKYPDSYLALVTFVQNKDLVVGNPFLNEVILYDKNGSEKGWGGNWMFAQEIKKRKFDVVIHLHATNRMHWMGWLAEIPNRIGWNRKSAWTLTIGIEDIKVQGQRHEASYNYELLKRIGVVEPEEKELYFPLHEKNQKSLAMLLERSALDPSKKTVVIAPSASCPSKKWSALSFARLAESVYQKYGCNIALVGSSADEQLLTQIKNQSNIACTVFAGTLSLGMLGWFLKSAALLISNDSGPVHIATAVGTPVISLFGRNQPGLSPTRWAPLGKLDRYLWRDVGCETCLAHDCEINFLCLDAISVADVMHEVEEISNRHEEAML